MKTPDQDVKNTPKQEIDKTRKKEGNLLSDDELAGVAGGTTNFETAAGKAFTEGLRRAVEPK